MNFSSNSLLSVNTRGFVRFAKYPDEGGESGRRNKIIVFQIKKSKQERLLLVLICSPFILFLLKLCLRNNFHRLVICFNQVRRGCVVSTRIAYDTHTNCGPLREAFYALRKGWLPVETL